MQSYPIVKSGLSDAYYPSCSRPGEAGSSWPRRVRTELPRRDVRWPQYSLFTEHLLVACAVGWPANDGLVRIFDLFEYLQPRVTAAARPYEQHPVFKADLEENFPVALYRGGSEGGRAARMRRATVTTPTSVTRIGSRTPIGYGTRWWHGWNRPACGSPSPGMSRNPV